MTALETLEHTVRSEQHILSRTMAKAIYERVETMLNAGENSQAVYNALQELYRRYREDGTVVERDAVAEVLDAFDGLCSPESALGS